MKKKTAKIKTFSLFLMFIFFFILTIFMPLNFAKADNIVYSDVLTDLQTDSNFSVEDYPVVENDYSLQVIQVAESVNNELFVYVYQPSGELKDLVATEIRMSTGINDNAKWEDYSLELLSKEGALYKYKIKDFSVKVDALRYYDISAIFRTFDETIDKKLENGNLINEISFEVGQLWTFSTVEGQVSCSCLTSEVINIVDKYVGFVRYENGSILWMWDACDSYYVAFSTDKKIEKLIEADVSFLSRGYTIMYTFTGQKNINYSDYQENDITLTYDSVADAGFGTGNNYTWKRIQSVSDFISGENLTDEAVNNLNGKEWVLRFAEPEYGSVYGGSTSYRDVTEISEVTILRLKFETEGVVYNIGVVDNKQTGDSQPDNIKGDDPIVTLLKKIAIAILIIGSFIVLAPVIPTVLVFIGKVVWWILKAIWWLITLPLELFKK